jgi:putative endonuclease
MSHHNETNNKSKKRGCQLKTGAWGEEKAVLYLKSKGYQILERNYRSKIGEIDIIAMMGDMICFVEVKTRKSLGFGLPCEAVNHEKIRHLRRMAQWYLGNCTIRHSSSRIDVIQIYIVEGRSYINHIEDAVI